MLYRLGPLRASRSCMLSNQPASPVFSCSVICITSNCSCLSAIPLQCPIRRFGNKQESPSRPTPRFFFSSICVVCLLLHSSLGSADQASILTARSICPQLIAITSRDS
ncbi:hypothetical protein BDZ91DRAFT_728013, partial [Kalaharituber pfeilii]